MFGTMGTCHGELEWTKKVVDLGDRSSTHDGQRAARDAAQLAQRGRHPSWHDDLVGPARQRDERSVEIKKQRGVGG
jgi:hypothetical protein